MPSYFFPLILLVILLAVFGAHYLLYRSILFLFSVTNPFQKQLVMTSLSLLSVSFIAATFILRWQENFFTRGYYILSGFWIGLLINLLLASAIVFFILWLTRLASLHLNMTIISGMIFATAFMYSLYGVWNALHPQLNYITVTIPHLPDLWKGKRIVQISDVHLGNINGVNFAERVAEMVDSVEPELVLITGDIFDGMDGSVDSFAKPLGDIQAKKGIYYITGNHETYLGTDNIFRVLQRTNISVLNDTVVDIDGLKLVGILYPDRNGKKDVLKILDNLKDEFINHPTILLYHSPVNIAEAKKAGVNLQLSGHTHRGQLFPLNTITKLVYGKYHYGLHTEGDFSIYTTNGTGTWGPLMRTGNTPEIVVITLQ